MVAAATTRSRRSVVIKTTGPDGGNRRGRFGRRCERRCKENQCPPYARALRRSSGRHSPTSGGDDDLHRRA
jgi:hypothetical protein